MAKIIHPYKKRSASVKRLLALTDTNNYYPRFVLNGYRECPVINWGSSKELPQYEGHIFNKPRNVRNAIDKRAYFRALEYEGVPTVKHTTRRHVAQMWLDRGMSVCVRKLIKSHSGRGMSVCNPGDYLEAAPLYTMYQYQDEEYRVHVVQNRTTINKKQRRKAVLEEDANYQIRTHANGFLFSRKPVGEAIEGPLVETAQAVRRALGLDFCAVDVVYNKAQDRYYPIEANTAPGVVGSLVEWYSEALHQMVAHRE